MKRLLIAAALLMLPVTLLAQVADRDVLLTRSGTLYTIDSVENDGAAPANVTRYLTLTIQNENQPAQTVMVPDSLNGGINWRPALAYDDASQTLFIFWLKEPNPMSSELLLGSYSNGQFRPTLSIDNEPYCLRFNLRIAITRFVSQLQKDGSYADAPALLVHAIWWEVTGYGEKARYALIPISRGVPGAPDIHDLGEFAASQPLIPAQTPGPNFNPEILQQPAFVDNGTADSIDVIFGDTYYDDFSRVTLKPVSDGRIHIPIGAHPGGPGMLAPVDFSANWDGRISMITSPHDPNTLLLYNTTSTSVSYIAYSGGSWSNVKSLQLSNNLSADAAVAALTRMMSQ